MVMTKQRLDTLLAERGLFCSRTRAAASVMAGEVSVGPDRRRASKPGELVAPDAQISVRERPSFVSRGGVKLSNALSASGLDVQGRWALDVGCSTGGFTDCLLQRGTSGVIAVDVGYGDLDYRLRCDPRVTVLERTNARSLTPDMLPYTPDLTVIDVSFISLRKILPSVLACLGRRHDVLALVKPQFEVGRERVGKGGVVRSPEDRRAALVAVGSTVLELGESVLGFYPSGLPGPKGNLETFVWVSEHDPPIGVRPAGDSPAEVRSEGGRPPGARTLREIERMAGEVEP